MFIIAWWPTKDFKSVPFGYAKCFIVSGEADMNVFSIGEFVIALIAFLWWVRVVNDLPFGKWYHWNFKPAAKSHRRTVASAEQVAICGSPLLHTAW